MHPRDTEDAADTFGTRTEHGAAVGSLHRLRLPVTSDDQARPEAGPLTVGDRGKRSKPDVRTDRTGAGAERARYMRLPARFT